MPHLCGHELLVLAAAVGVAAGWGGVVRDGIRAWMRGGRG